MTKSKLTSKKVLINIAIVAVAVGLTIWGLSPAMAAVNQTMTGVAPSYAQVPKITGSVYARQPPKIFIKDNLKVSFPQAAEIVGKEFANGIIVTGQLGEVQGYLVYTFFVVNGENNMGFLAIVDAGNGKVLHTSQSLPWVA